MTKNKEPIPIRYKIAQLNQLKEQGLMDDEKIELLRRKGLIIEKRKKEVRAIKGTHLIPKFFYKNPLNEPITELAYDVQKKIEDGLRDVTEVLAQYPSKIKKTETLKKAEKVIVDAAVTGKAVKAITAKK